jgi:hypothetical protein
MAESPLHATVTAFYAYDIGFGVSLTRAELLLREQAAPGQNISQPPAVRDNILRERKGPRYFQYSPAPLQLTQSPGAGPAAPQSSCLLLEHNIIITLYDFGGVSIAYPYTFRGTPDELSLAAASLYDNISLLEDSRRRTQKILAAAAPAVSKPIIEKSVEDYVVVHLHAPQTPGNAAEWVHLHRQLVARVLRAEPSPLCEQEVTDATGLCLSYSPSDIAVVDWHGALLIGEDMEDAKAVLEFANIELLEMRLLDEKLDRSLEKAYLATSKPPRAFFRRDDQLREIAGMQVDSSLLFESVNNTLKLVGDQYLARLYHAAITRLHLPEWDASIIRKLSTLEGMYGKLNDERANRRMEALEWIIIGLIMFEIFAQFIWPLLVGLVESLRSS